VTVEEGPHDSPTPRWLEGSKSQIGVLDGEESENVLVGREGVCGRVLVFERVEVGDARPAESHQSADQPGPRGESPRPEGQGASEGIVRKVRHQGRTSKSRKRGSATALPR
jgi:hypothetical protein